MADEEKTDVEVVVKKVTAMKKAGMPALCFLIMAIVGAPGFWEWLDNTEDEAKVKAEVSYVLLKDQSEGLALQVQDTRQEVKDLRTLFTQLLLQRAEQKGAAHPAWPSMGSVMYGGGEMPGMPTMPPEPMPSAILSPLPDNLDSAAAAVMAEE